MSEQTPYFFDPARWGVHLPRDIDDVVEQTLSDELLAWIRDNPQTFAPANRYYVKNHVNAPGTVRGWFREMRAADFHRALPGNGVVGWVTGWEKWTLFDTMKVVDRETAPHYGPSLTTIYFVQDGCVVGKVENVALERPPYPMFSSNVPEATGSLSLDSLRQWWPK